MWIMSLWGLHTASHASLTITTDRLCCKYCLILDTFPLPHEKKRLEGSSQEWCKRCWNKQNQSSELPYPPRTAHKTCSGWDWPSYSSGILVNPATNTQATHTQAGYKYTQLILKSLKEWYLHGLLPGLQQMLRSLPKNTHQLQRETIFQKH